MPATSASRTGGDVIVLNGPSSAGKTAIARELSQAAGDAYVVTGIDAFLAGIDPAALSQPEWATLSYDECGILVDVRLGVRAKEFLGRSYRAIAELARGGTPGGSPCSRAWLCGKTTSTICASIRRRVRRARLH